MMRQLLIALCVGLTLCACSSIDCPVQNLVRTYYELHTSPNVKDTLKDTLNVRSVRVNGTDTLLLNKYS
mgnify:CR=1 FL=1